MKKKKVSKPKKETQMKLGIKYHGIPFFQRIKSRVWKTSVVLEQFVYWRSPLVWLSVFVNASFSILVATWFFSKTDVMPPFVPLFYYFHEIERTMIASSYIPLIIGVNVLMQLLLMIINAKIFLTSRGLSRFLMCCTTLIALLFYAAIYKTISLSIP